MGYNDSRMARLVSERMRSSLGLDQYLVKSDSEREEIFQLRYEAYRNEGLIREKNHAKLSDREDFEGDAEIFGITLNGCLVSTIRLGIISQMHKTCTTYSVFKDDLDPIISVGGKIADGSRLAVHCDNSADRRRVVMHALRLAAIFARTRGAEHGAIIARHSHAPFYQHYGFVLVNGPISYHEALTPLSLMMIDLRRPWK